MNNAYRFKMLHLILLVLTAITVLVFSLNNNIYSYPGGITGFTRKTNASGCQSCHGNSSSSVNVSITGPSTLKTGESGTYNVKITGGTGTKVGVDIASSDGSLTPISSSLKAMNAELTHNSAQRYSGGSYSFSFKYTAPALPGPQLLYACGVSTKPQWNFAPDFSVTVQNNTTDVKEGEVSPDNYSLAQNYPNPFNPSSIIKYSLAKESRVRVVIFNTIGEEITTLVNRTQSGGFYEVKFDGSDLPSGIYIYSLEAESVDGKDNFKTMKKMMLLK